MDTTISENALMRIGSPQLCHRCDRTIAWARTRKNKRICIDFYASAEGTFIIERHDELGNAVVAKVVGGTAMEVPHYTCHFNTCPSRPRTPKRNYSRRLSPTNAKFKREFDARAKART